jgi:hypothetical protein
MKKVEDIRDPIMDAAAPDLKHRWNRREHSNVKKSRPLGLDPHDHYRRRCARSVAAALRADADRAYGRVT